jgi:hypothetical protein
VILTGVPIEWDRHFRCRRRFGRSHEFSSS